MPLESNTQTFVDISTDVKRRLDSGELVAENAPDYMQRRWGISVEEYNNAATRAIKDEDAYYARIKQMEDSPLSGLASKPPVPAHLRSVEGGGLLSLPGRVITNIVTGAVGKAVDGIGQTARFVVGENRANRAVDIMDQAVDTLSANPYIAPFVDAVKGRFTDPVLTPVEDFSAELLSILVPGGAATKALKATTALKGSKYVAPYLGYGAADVIVSDKDESLVKTILEKFPETVDGVGLTSVLEAIAVNPDDPVALNMLRKFGEGVALSIPLDAAVSKISKVLKSRAAAKAAAEAASPPQGATAQAAPTPTGTAPGAVGQAAPTPTGTAGQAVSTPTGTAPGVTTQAAPTPSSRDPFITLSSDPTVENAPGFLARFFGSRAGLGEQGNRAVEFNRTAKQAAEGLGNSIFVDTKKVIEKAFGQTYDNLDIAIKDNISKAFGRVVQVADGAPPNIKKILNTESAKRSVADTLALKNYADPLYRRELAERTAAQAALPIEVRTAIEQARNLIDDNSDKIIKSGLVSKETAEAIEKGKGTYSTTDFEIYRNKKWQNEIIQAFESKRAKGTPEANAALDGLETHLRNVNPTFSDDGIEGLVQGVINSIKKNKYDDLVTILQISKDGASSSSKNAAATLGKRIVLTPDLKPFYRQIEDPLYKMKETLSKQGTILADFKLASDLKQIASSPYAKNIASVGKPSNQFSESLEGLANDFIKSATLGGKNPLANVFVTREFKEALTSALSPAKNDGPVFKILQTFQYASSSAATTLSAATHLVNMKGNIIIMFMNGNAPYLFKSIPDAIKSSPDLQRLFTRAGSGEVKVSIQELKRLKELGLIDNSVTVAFLEASISKDMFSKVPLFKRGLDLASDFYKLEDTVFKLLNFSAERSRYKRAFKNLTDKELDAYAAEIVKETTPTYSRLSSFFKGMRNVPIVGVFPSFFHESFRVSKNMVKIGLRDMFTGAKEGNPQLMAAGAERLASVAAVAWFAESEIISNKKENNITDNNNKAIEKLSPVYEKNMNRIFVNELRRNPLTGHIETSYFSTSAIDPFDTVRKTFKLATEAIFKGDMTEKNFEEYLDKLGQIVSPIISYSLPIGAIIDVASNKTSTGAALLKEGMTTAEKAWYVSKELGKTFAPRTLIDLYKYYEASESESSRREKLSTADKVNKEFEEFTVGTSESGFPLRKEDARARAFFGAKRITQDFNESLQYKIADLSRGNSDIGKQLNKYITGLVNKGVDWNNPQVVADFYQEVNDYSTKAYNQQKVISELLHDMKKVTYREKKGSPLVRITDLEIAKILSDNGMRKYNKEYDYSLIRTNSEAIGGGDYIGRFLPPTISQELINKATKPVSLGGKPPIPSDIMIKAAEILSKAYGTPLLQVKQ